MLVQNGPVCTKRKINNLNMFKFTVTYVQNACRLFPSYPETRPSFSSLPSVIIVAFLFPAGREPTASPSEPVSCRPGKNGTPTSDSWIDKLQIQLSVLGGLKCSRNSFF